MAGLIVQTEPTSEPVSLVDAKNFLKLSVDDDDVLIGIMITAAREAAESFCARSFAIKSYLQVHDAFPYYTDTQFSQQAYPPNYSSLSAYSTTMWNYSQMIKLGAPPAIAVQGIDYIAFDGTTKTLLQDTDFVLDNVQEPSRIFPMPGGMWPPCAYTPNAVHIRFTAGFGSAAVDPTPVDGEVPKGAGSQPMPGRVKLAILQSLANWYENRESVTAAAMKELPQHCQMLLWSLRVMDMAPTRG